MDEQERLWTGAEIAPPMPSVKAWVPTAKPRSLRRRGARSAVFTLYEVLGHLELLADTGRVATAMSDGVVTAVATA